MRAAYKCITALLLFLSSAAQANEADNAIHQLVSQAREYAAARNAEELAKTLYGIAEAMPNASADGVAAVDELKKKLAGSPVDGQRQEAVRPAVPKAVDAPLQPTRGAATQQSILPVERTAPSVPQRAPARVVSPALETPQASPALLELLRRRGASAFSQGDISGARLFYQRSADGGCGPCAEAMAQTYDAEQLRRVGAMGIKPDPALAEAWHVRARQLTQSDTTR